MLENPQTVQALRGDVMCDATLAWRFEHDHWVVEVSSAELEPVSARADDAFEALGLVRAELEPVGWRIGVAGAQPDVWPSGMSRDQGGGLTAYRMTAEGAGDRVDTFEPVHPVTVTTIAEQRAGIERLTGMVW